MPSWRPGTDSFTLKVAVESVQHLERLIDKN